MTNQTRARSAGIFRMPAVFGPTPGPRQAPAGMSFDQTRSPLKDAAYAIFRADAGALADLMPGGFRLRGEPCVAFEFSCLQEIAWLAGRGYNMLTVRVPVSFDHQGQSVEGWFQPVCWENMADPIISGREELGWSKVFADLRMTNSESGGTSIAAEWDGFRFMEFEVDARADAAEPAVSTQPVFHQKVIPRTGAWGDDDVNYITMTPAGGATATLLQHRVGSAQVRIHQATWEQMPTQSHIVEKLVRLQIGESLAAGTIRTRGGKDLSDQVQLVER